MRAFEILNEMVLRTERTEDNENVIAHRDSIWLVPDEDIPADVSEDIAARTGLEPSDTYANFQEQGYDGRPDVIFGVIDGETLYLTNRDDAGHNPVTSLLIKKVVHQLGLRKVETNYVDGEEEVDEITYKGEMLGRIPDVVYHGTASRYIGAILRQGIGPNSNANWPKVGKFHDRVFLTARKGYAKFHANRALESGGIPIIVATRLPDRNLIDLDFDVAGTYYGSDHARTQSAGYSSSMKTTGHYAHAHTTTQEIIKRNAGTDYTRESGVFAYKGRIPASFIQFYVVPGGADGEKYIDDHAVRVAPADILKALDMIEEYGFYDPDYEPEEQEDDEDLY